MTKEVPGFFYTNDFKVKYASYLADDSGYVTSVLTGWTESFRVDRDGYLVVSLQEEGKVRKMKLYIHRIIAELFIENPDGYAYISHIDEDLTNNSVENLRWVPLSEIDNCVCTIRGDKSYRGLPFD